MAGKPRGKKKSPANHTTQAPPVAVQRWDASTVGRPLNPGCLYYMWATIKGGRIIEIHRTKDQATEARNGLVCIYEVI